MKNTNTIFITVVISLLMGNINALNWQGYGNMSSSNLTDIWTFVDSHISDAVTNTKYTQFVTNMSDHLNTLWHPAWNVFLLQTSVQRDAVLYGYAFRDHWMWYNGYRVNGAILGFVIWKDYNCHTWGMASFASSSGFSQSEKDDINAVGVQTRSSNERQDIWMLAKRYMNALVAKANFNSPQKAYSMVITQAKRAQTAAIFGRICMVGTKQITNIMGLKDGSNAVYTIFQTRQSI